MTHVFLRSLMSFPCVFNAFSSVMSTSCLRATCAFLAYSLRILSVNCVINRRKIRIWCANCNKNTVKYIYELLKHKEKPLKLTQKWHQNDPKFMVKNDQKRSVFPKWIIGNVCWRFSKQDLQKGPKEIPKRGPKGGPFLKLFLSTMASFRTPFLASFGG